MVCKKCGAVTKYRQSYCSEICLKTRDKTEWRKKVSEGRKKFLAENPDKHPWKSNSKFKSVPCETLKEYLRKRNISFVEEWQPLESRGFSIDIAFPDKKIGFEINGNQHYDSTGKLKPYYQERHDLIVSSGWKLIELHYSIAYKPELLDKLFDFENNKDYSQYENVKINKKQKPEKKPNSSERAKLRWTKYIDVVKNSDIDFSKFGWVNKVAVLLSLPSQKVNKWMKKYMLEFYTEHCFKKKISR